MEARGAQAVKAETKLGKIGISVAIKMEYDLEEWDAARARLRKVFSALRRINNTREEKIDTVARILTEF